MKHKINYRFIATIVAIVFVIGFDSCSLPPDYVPNDPCDELIIPDSYGCNGEVFVNINYGRCMEPEENFVGVESSDPAKVSVTIQGDLMRIQTFSIEGPALIQIITTFRTISKTVTVECNEHD